MSEGEVKYQYTRKQLQMVMRSWGVSEPVPASGKRVLVSFPDEVLDSAVITLTDIKSTDGEPLFEVVMSSSKDGNQMHAMEPHGDHDPNLDRLRIGAHWGDYSILRGVDIYSPQAPAALSKKAQHIYDTTMQAMRPAEEIGGPEGNDYINLMEAIKNEASKRLRAFMEWWRSPDSPLSKSLGEPSNEDRAGRIDALLKEYAEMRGEPSMIDVDQFEVASLMTDIRHWCDKNNISFSGIAELSHTNYLQEQPQKTLPGSTPTPSSKG